MSRSSDPKQTIVANYRELLAARALPHLTISKGLTILRAVPIGVEPLVIGRDPSREFHLLDDDVSRAHCEVRLSGDDVLVRDLGSTNGTFIDGRRISGERPLPVSAQLRVGRHTLRHELLTAAEVAKHAEFAKDLERARRYVEALIPAPIEAGELRTDWCFEPSSVLGGDALGYHELDGGRMALYVLDVCGHGVGAAMHSASVLNVLRSRTLANTDFGEPASVLTRLNDAFPMESHNGAYFSIFYAVLELATGRLRYSSAGHPPALVRAVDGALRARLALKQPPIGMLSSAAFTQAEVVLQSGERLYAFSDGVYELCDRDGRQLGLEDFERALASDRDASRGEPRRRYESACSLAGSGGLEDDFTLLIVERRPTAA